jgi:hypothetical protein
MSSCLDDFVQQVVHAPLLCTHTNDTGRIRSHEERDPECAFVVLEMIASAGVRAKDL